MNRLLRKIIASARRTEKPIPMNTISPLAFVDPAAALGADVTVESGAWIGPGSRIGDGAVVQSNAVIGRAHIPGQNEPTVVGPRCIVGSGAVLYHDVTLHENAKVWHNAVIRAHVTIGAGASIGSLSCIEIHTTIGRGTSVHGLCQIGDYSSVGDFVFIGPGFLSVSDIALDYKRPHLHQPYSGVTIKDKARIGGRVFAYPGSIIGEETVVGANSVVKGELLDRVIYMGDPIRPVRKVKPEEFFPGV